MNDENNKTPCIVSATGAKMMTLEGIERDGDHLAVQGALMGLSPITMYVQPYDVLRILCLFFKPHVIGYLLSLPFILLKRKLNKDSNP